MNVTRTCLIGSLLGALATPAFAQYNSSAPQLNGAATPYSSAATPASSAATPASSEAPVPGTAPDGLNAVSRGIQGPAGTASARVLVDGDVSTNSVGTPTSVVPDLFYSVTDQLQLGLVHQGPMGWQAQPGLGVCLAGKDNGCRKIYDNAGLDVLYGLPTLGKLELSAHGAFFANHFDPVTNVALGVTGKAHLADNVALVFDPKIAIELTKRDRNDDFLYMPVELAVQVGAPLTFHVLTGISGSLSSFGDTYEIPAGIGLVRNLNKNFDVGARFSLDNLLGQQPQDTGRADARSAALLVNIRI